MKLFLTLLTFFFIGATNAHNDYNESQHCEETKPTCFVTSTCVAQVSDCAVTSFNGSVSYQWGFAKQIEVTQECISSNGVKNTIVSLNSPVWIDSGVNNRDLALKECQSLKRRFLSTNSACPEESPETEDSEEATDT